MSRLMIGIGVLVLLILSGCTGPAPAAVETPVIPAEGAFCTGVTEIPGSECQALVDFYEATGDKEWVDNSGWLDIATPCRWPGITCANGHVDSLALFYSNLQGELPASLAGLSHLRLLDLHNNALGGSIPPELGQLSALETLDLSANRLEGVIPPALGVLPALQTLVLSDNGLTGAIPADLGKISTLRNLDLSRNQLTGAIPPSLADLTRLETVRLAGNRLEGAIPFALGELSSVAEIDLSFNRLQGAVPSTLYAVPIHRLWGNQLDGNILLDGGEAQTVNYLGASFSFERSLADNVWAEMVPERPAQPGPGVMWAPADYIVFTLVREGKPQNHNPLGLYLPSEAQIHIYPTAGLNVEVQPAVVTLRELLTAEPDPASYEATMPEAGATQPGLAMLPPSNAVQMFRAQAQYLSFAGGRGIRYLTQLSQGPVPVSNQELFYTFQGLTDDGATYVAAYFPVALPALPDTHQLNDEAYAAMMEGWPDYVAETVDLLNEQPATAYTPDLAALDALISSLSVSGLTSLPEIEVLGPAQGESVDGQPVLQWANFPGTKRYEVIVVDDGAYPPAVVFSQFTTDTTLAVPTDLDPGSYSWTVRAQDSDGKVVAELNSNFIVNATP